MSCIQDEPGYLIPFPVQYAVPLRNAKTHVRSRKCFPREFSGDATVGLDALSTLSSLLFLLDKKRMKASLSNPGEKPRLVRKLLMKPPSLCFLGKFLRDL